MNTVSILIIDDAHPIMLQKFKDANFRVTHNEDMTIEEVQRVIPNYDGVIVRSKIIADAAFLDSATNLKCIGRVGAGMETIDMDYAQSKHIACFNSPEGNMDAVGEQNVGVLLALLHNVVKANSEVKNQLLWDREGNRGVELKGKTVGIIGYGNMGKSFAKKLAGFECNVIAYDKYKTNFSDEFAREVSLQELQATAHIVSYHVPQTSETIGMCNKEFIDACSLPFILLNTARGKVVNTADLVYGLQSSKIVAAGLDVLEYESYNFQDFLTDSMPDAFNYIKSSNRVILTPHIAGWTVESKERLSAVLADKIVNYFASLK